MGIISIIANKVEYIGSVILERFHLAISMEPVLTLHISTFNLVTKMTRSYSEHQQDFLQCDKKYESGSVFGLSLTDIFSNFSKFYNLVTHYLPEKLMEMGAEDPLSQVITSYSIFEVSQYEFYM